jgi:bifunctional DNA-binding transcriptional regulator/antitoxin component of YhaV-PrlF toxin-antitoxin module
VVDIPSTELFTSLFNYYYDILKNMKNMYIVQPYAVGSKSAKVKSLAFVIPAPVREKARIVASSTLMLQLDEKMGQITVSNLDKILERYKNNIPATKSYPGYPEQESETQ